MPHTSPHEHTLGIQSPEAGEKLVPLRVAYVLKRYPRYSETFVVNEILAHEAAGWDIEIFSLRPPMDTHFQDRIARVKAPVTYLPSGSLKATDFWKGVEVCSGVLADVWASLEWAQGESVGDIYHALLLACALRSKGINHVHAHFATSATTVARLAARFAGLTYTFTAHAKDIFHESVQADDLERKLNDAAGVVTVSQYNLCFLREAHGAAAARVERVYNGLDLDEFPYQEPQDRPRRIVAVGRLIEKKGFADLIDACAILAEQGNEFECQIVGTGELEADLRDRVRQRGLEDSVYLLGPRPQIEVIQLVRSAAALAAPCVVAADGNRDGLPTVLLEAMALGTPCVSTDVTGIPEVLRHRETGLLVPQHDAVSLAGALERLLKEPALRCEVARGARELIETEFDVHRNAARIRDMFEAARRSLAGRQARQDASSTRESPIIPEEVSL